MNLPADLILAIVVMIGVSVCFACIGIWIARRFSRTVSAIPGFVAVGLLLIHAFWLADNLCITRLLPIADVIIYGNIQGPAMGLLAGIAMVRMPGSFARRMVLVTPLICIGIWRIVSPVIGTAPQIGPDRCVDGLCRQSSTSSCSAAAAATLLMANGIPTTEREMIAACLTHIDGTSMLGLYRGLKMKTKGTAFTPVAMNYATRDPHVMNLPAVATISLPGLPRGWQGIGNRHSIVVRRITDDGRVDIGDPFAGNQLMSVQEFSRSWNGDAIYLSQRK